ncbi:MAG: acyltransferase family protein [Pseudomonadota bacterium]
MRRAIDPGLSIYLDLVRVVAATVVMLAHAQVSGLIDLRIGLLEFAPAAVIVFFVLSGFIIESTTDPQAGLRRYAVNRAARIYSVVLPALAVSYALSFAYAWSQGAAEANAFAMAWGQWWRLAAALTFQSEDWFLGIGVPWDGPFWSLNYEVFYYVFYAAIRFLSGRTRVAAALAVAVVGGPNILLLLPCWWAGVWLARRPDLAFPSDRVARWVLWLSPVALAGFVLLTIPGRVFYYLRRVVPDLGLLDHSKMFLTDYLVAAIVVASFVAARQLRFGADSMLVRLGGPITAAAGYTFSIYLLHRPFQHLAGQFYRVQRGDALTSVALQVLILMAIVAIGTVTERRTHAWRRAIGRVLRV